MGCWTPLEGFAATAAEGARWSARPLAADFSQFEVLEAGVARGAVRWSMLGAHNMDECARRNRCRAPRRREPARASEALAHFQGVARRMQLRGEVGGVKVYDDFAHHPTAIVTTIDGLRRRVGAARILAVLEPRSHTMRMGVHQHTLAPSFAGADEVWLYAPPDLGWDVGAVLAALGARGHVSGDVNTLARELARAARPGDQVLIMSNGGFGGLHGKLLAELEAAKRGT